MPPLTFEYEITQPEFSEMAWLRHRRSSRWIAGVVIGILIFLLGILFYKYADHWLGVVFLIMSIFLILMQWIVPSAVIRRTYRRNQKMFGKRIVTITGNGVQSDHELGRSEATWNMYEKFHETPRLFLLFQTADVVGILPKRVFAHPDDIEDFRALLVSRIPRK
jgi:hypothetical protein